MIGAVRHLLPQELSVAAGGVAAPTADRLLDRPMIVLVGLTGAGKTTTVERLQATLPLAAVLPDRRALTDRLILPLMTGAAGPVTDRVERFRLTAAFKERHPGGMGDLLAWLVLPPGLPPGPLLFDGLRGAAEASAAAAALPRAHFLVLDCSPEGRLRRLCGRNDPFDHTAAGGGGPAAGDAVAAIDRTLSSSGFDALVPAAVAARLASDLAGGGADPATVARSAAIIVEESRHYDPSAARAALLRQAAARTLVLDSDASDADQVAAAAADWAAAAWGRTASAQG